MDRVLVVTVLLLVQPALHQCRHLPPDLGNSVVRSGLQLDLENRYSLLPTPNTATPLIGPDTPLIAPSAPIISPISPLIAPSSPFIAPFYLSSESEVESSPIVLNTDGVSISSGFHPDFTIDKKHRKVIKKLYHENGKVWTKFPNKKHLVEIVPFRHKSKIPHGKGNKLAYILPKPKIVKKNLEGHDYNHSELESSEENYSTSSSEQKDSSEFPNSFSTESNSVEHYDPIPQHSIQHHHNNKKKHNRNDSENMINSKVNDLVLYLKEHNDGSLDKLIHDTVQDTEDSGHHLHYIIPHKNNHAHKHDWIDDNEVIDNSALQKPHKVQHSVSGNVRHRDPKDIPNSEDTSVEQAINHGSNHNHVHNFHHIKKDIKESSEFPDIHYVLENTDQGSPVLPNFITESLEPYPEIIKHIPHHANHHDVLYITDSVTAPEFIPHLPKQDILEPDLNEINYIPPEVIGHGHHLIKHLSSDIENSYINDYIDLFEVENPNVPEYIASSLETNLNTIPSANGGENEFLKETINSDSGSSKSDSIEDSPSLSSDESSADNTDLFSDISAIKQKVDSSESSDSISLSDSKSEELVQNSNTYEESTGIGEENASKLGEDILQNVYQIDENPATSEETYSSEGKSVENVLSTKDNKDAIPVNDLLEHIEPECVKSQMHKKTCNRHKYYKLTFVFNR